MPRLTYVAVALLLCAMAQPAQAKTIKLAHKAPPALTLPQPHPEPPGYVKAGLLQAAQPAASRERVAVCANLAGVRALEARAGGASFAMQDRVLDVSFVLCMAQSGERD